jgi:hypothetical protein
MIETLIVLENRGCRIGECGSRYLAILKEWRKEARKREEGRSTCVDGGGALELLERIRGWLLRQQEILTADDNDLPF